MIEVPGLVLCFGPFVLFALGFLGGLVFGDSDGRKAIKEWAIKEGVARWELESQDNPTPVFRWNVPEEIESSSATGPEQRGDI